MRIISAACAALMAFSLAACGTAPEDTPLGKAQEKCTSEVDKALADDSEFKDTEFAKLQDDGKSLSIGAPSNDEEGDLGELTGDLYSAVTATLASCTLDELDGPDSVRSKMESTTALMGRQTDEFGDFEVSWSYHPDNGFDATFEQVED